MTTDIISHPMTSAAVFVALCSAIGTLWKVLHTQSVNVEKRLTSKLDQCEEKHSEVTAVLVTMATDLGELKGRQEGINSLAEQVLQVVASNKTTRRRTTKDTKTDGT